MRTLPIKPPLITLFMMHLITTFVVISSFKSKIFIDFSCSYNFLVLQTVNEMQEKRVYPNRKVFLSVLDSLSKRGHLGPIRDV